MCASGIIALAAEKRAVQVQEKSGDLKKNPEILKKNKALHFDFCQHGYLLWHGRSHCGT
jgi:hypothetical protein